ncbi:MAG TPA: hypothetical protein VHK28_09290, partial [Candidatus Limnocylindria bacterium]|nr:hypothetical protein [Candidatus Limnocylindria bacterium]
ARVAVHGSRRALVVTGLSLIVAGIGLATSVLVSGVPVWVAGAAWAVAGLGMGLAFSTATLSAIEGAPVGAEGSTSGAVQLANILGVAVGTGVAGAVVAVSGPTLGLAPGIAIANLLMLVACAAGIAVVGRLPDTPPSGAAARSMPAEHGPAL